MAARSPSAASQPAPLAHLHYHLASAYTSNAAYKTDPPAGTHRDQSLDAPWASEPASIHHSDYLARSSGQDISIVHGRRGGRHEDLREEEDCDGLDRAGVDSAVKAQAEQCHVDDSAQSSSASLGLAGIEDRRPPTRRPIASARQTWTAVRDRAGVDGPVSTPAQQSYADSFPPSPYFSLGFACIHDRSLPTQHPTASARYSAVHAHVRAGRGCTEDAKAPTHVVDGKAMALG